MTAPTESVSLTKPVYARGKHIAHHIFLDTMAMIGVPRAMRSKLKREAGALVAGAVSIPLLRPPRVIAFGKAAIGMTAVLDEILSGQIETGVVVAPSEPTKKLERFRYFVGGHPYPNSGTLEGTEVVLELLHKLTPDDFVIFLVSGGGSALLEEPLDKTITLADLREFNQVLVTCGLPIEQINVLRKHLSAVKGGRLAVRAYPARQLTIFISDVPEHLPSMVASGPTMPDESTTQQAYAIADQQGLVPKFPARIRKHFEQHTLEETPKPDERFANSRYFCLLSNRDAMEAAKSAAEGLGFLSHIDTNVWDADYKQVAQATLASLDTLAQSHRNQPVCLVAGGEVNCAVTGHGTGGRNQAFVLYAAQLIAGQKRVVLSAGTDGRDGNSPASGAIGDGQTVSRARALGLDPERYLAESDSYHFFCTLGETIDTGFTNNNVRDVHIFLHLCE